MNIHLAEGRGIRLQILRVPGDEEAALPDLHALKGLE